MKLNKFVAPVMAGALTLTLGLVGCGGSSTTESTTAPATEETTETAPATTETTPAPAETTPAPAATTEAESKILYWEGESDKGDVLLYSEDETDNTATVILFGDHDDKDELLAFSGPATVEGDKLTITDAETGDTFTFTVTGQTQDAVTIDLGVHGAGTLKPVTEQQFNDEIDGIINVAREVGELLETLDDQDVEELLSILEFVLSDTDANATAQTTATTQTTAPAQTTETTESTTPAETTV